MSNLEKSGNTSTQTAETLRSPLDEIQARADAATEVPWRIENDSECDYESGIPYSEWPQTLVGPETAHMSAWSKKHGNPHRVDEINELKFPDAVFIAHAREDVPRLVKAIRAVESLHRRYGLYELEDSCPNTDDEHRQERHHECDNEPSELYCEDMPVGAKCDQCSDEYGDDVAWPCPTITAIREALG